MRPRYIGLENELITFSGGKRRSFKRYFKSFTREKEDFFKSETSIRTRDGIGYYVDGAELEIVTPPIAMTKGYATRLHDALMRGRERVVEFGEKKSLAFTGYSMHWNISKHSRALSGESLLQHIALPFRLFGNTPLSCGIGGRERKRGNTNCYELLSDSINSPEQIRATALLLGAIVIAAERYTAPFDFHSFRPRDQNFLKDGRYTVTGFTSSKKGFTVPDMQAQHLLEVYYQWAQPFVEELGTDDEVKLLEDFVYMRKPLEFDKFALFAHLNNTEMDNRKPDQFRGVYPPFAVSGESTSIAIAPNDLPLECRLLGGIIEHHLEDIGTLDWEGITLNDGQSSRHDHIPGDVTTNTYQFLAEKLGESFAPEWVDTEAITPKQVAIPKEVEPVVYDPKKDIVIPKSPIRRVGYAKAVLGGMKEGMYAVKEGFVELLKYRPDYIFLYSLVLLGSFGIGALVGSLAKNNTIEERVEQRIEQIEEQEARP